MVLEYQKKRSRMTPMSPSPSLRPDAPAGLGRSRRIDLRPVDPAGCRSRLQAAVAALEPGLGLSFVSRCDLGAIKEVLSRALAGELEWCELESGPELWEVVVCRRRPGTGRNQVVELMQADHFLIDDLMSQASQQAARRPEAVGATCRRLAAALRRHLAVEDQVLMPLVAERLGAPEPRMAGLVRDHLEIERLLHELGEVGRRLEARLAGAHRLAETADRLEEVLLRHIRLEERVLYAVTDLLCTGEEREALLRRCQEAHAAAPREEG
jgi:hemerythrin-like domain-containing protein